MTNVAASPPRSAHESGTTLRDFLLFVSRNRWSAVIGAAVCAISALILAEILPPKYTASVTLLPATTQSGSLGSGALASALSQFSGVASLAGIHLGSESGLKTEALATLQSRLLINNYIQKHNLMPILFSSEWNSSTNTWKSHEPKDIPTLWDADQLFKRHIMTLDDNSKSSETGAITLTISWRNAKLAAQWANGLVKLTNDYLRQQTIDEANRDINYLNQEIGKTDIVAVKDEIYTLMQTEIKDEMVARGRTQFALRIIDPAIPPQEKTFPKPLIWTIAGTFGGIFLGLLAAVFREALTEENPSEQTNPALQRPDGKLPAAGTAPTSTEA